MSHPRLPQNAPGPFYSTGHCTACGAPEAEAPELLAPLTDDNWETYFVRQPGTPDEVEHACRALEVCCLMGLRYGGDDPAVIRRLGNRPAYCDEVLPGGPVRMPGESDDAWAHAQGFAPPNARARWWHWLLGRY